MAAGEGRGGLAGLRLRGGHDPAAGFKTPVIGEEDDGPLADRDAWWEGLTCQEYEALISLKRNVPMDNDHAPWLDARREAYIELKAHNFTSSRATQLAGLPPPKCPLVWCGSWDQYWEQWEMEWRGEPPDCGTGLVEPVYRRPHVTDKPPVIGLSPVSVEEEIVWHGEHANDSFPPGWPAALDDVLSEMHDGCEEAIGLNERLLRAAGRGDVGECVRLVGEGAQVHAGDTGNFDMTPLHHAAYWGHTELCDVLVRRLGADVNRGTLGGETPLHKAVQGNSTEAVSCLLSLHADPNARTGTRPQSPGTLWTPLHRAACQGYAECARMLLMAGSDANARGHTGWTPLMYAAVWAHEDVVKLLVERGADVHARSHVGNKTALDRVWECRFVPDSGKVKMRSRYCRIIRFLRESMGGWEPAVMPHWAHGQRGVEEVEEEHWARFGHFRDGTFLRAWRREANATRPPQPVVRPPPFPPRHAGRTSGSGCLGPGH